MSRCARCPSDVPDSAHFCPNCGTSATQDDGATRSRPVSPELVPREAPRRSSGLPATPPASSSAIDHGRFLPGSLVGERYRIVAMLGRGGMGEVYRADDLKVGQSVALKFLPARFAGDAERLGRLRGEVRAARDVSHPNVCRVYDIGEADGEHFISMELVQGEDLASLLRRIGHLPGDKGLQIARQLCSGVAAAHARGVLHRDLKPANVMLDERGTVRIMDFGLAGAQFEGDTVREGTPAYMAPEQLAGRSVSIASDVYALGLVLYEIFTGRQAFASGTPADMLRQREHESATPPSDLVDGIDDAVERAILRCLESDPAQRPSSASAIAVALPGGDPLAAALAAGETPSPDMVAAAGGEGALRPAAAWALSGGIVALLLIVALVWPFSTDLGVAPLPRSADALTDRARDVLRALGYEGTPADEVRWFDRNYEYLLYEATHLRPLRTVEAWPGSAGFLYRRSPRALVPFASPLVSLEDPPRALSGMTSLRLTPRGDLLELVVEPPQVEEGTGPWPEPDWKAVLAQTGLESKHLTPSEPRWAPPVASEVRMAWDGTPWPGRPPVRVEAAAFHGRPVYVVVLGPWNKPTRMPDKGDPRKGSLRVAIGAVVGNLLVSGVFVIAVVLAHRNLRLGRGHRRGAFRVAAAFVALAVLGWLFQAHHVADVAGEWRLFLVNVSVSVLGGGFVWLSYMALEPYVRRRWPSILIGWSRVLAGRLTDPLVGRDILIGALAGAALALVNHLANAIPAWVPLVGQTPIFSDRRALGSTSELMGLFTGVLSQAIISSLVLLGLLFVARLLLRRAWMAVALTALVLTLLNLGAENVAVESIVAVVSGVGPAVVLARYGLLSLWSMTLVSQMLIRFPVTLELTRWYGGGTVFLLAVLAALLAYAFRVSLGGRSAFAHPSLGE